MKIFQNKFFIICLAVALVLAIVPSTLSIMGFSGLSKNIVGTLTYPVRWCWTRLADGFEGIGRYFNSIDFLSDENERLREENEKLQAQIDRAKLLERENERLHSFLGIKNQYPSFTMSEAMVIGHSSGNYMTTFTLNRGSIHGITKNMPVITEAGIVGQVTEVGLNWCMVSTLIETAVSVGAYIPRSGEIGIVNGDYSMRYEGLCKISYLEADADVIVGDTVLSSGAGSVYPAELVIGTVTAIRVDEVTRTQIATVKPAVDLSDLKWVMIITGYQK